MAAAANNPQVLRPARSEAAKSLQGRITVAGDKSISHRALMLASQALGTTTISGLLEGEDVIATAEALKACGVSIVRTQAQTWVVQGVGIGGLREPENVLDMGNAGTAARLMMGLLAPYPYHVQFTGDASLRKRPMQRVITPLTQFGVQFFAREGGRLPLTMRGTASPLPITYDLPVASAQVKSAILLAGLNTPGETSVIEHEPTRDHTERMLKFFGVQVSVNSKAAASKITVHGQPDQIYADRAFEVPADPSSAAFPLVAALLVPGSRVCITNVCLNPTRTGLLDTLKEMGANIVIDNMREVAGETVGDITASHSALHGVDVPASRAPSMIDEYPILAIAAACAKGKTTMRGLSELRVKESDRLAAIVAGLEACGVQANAQGDDLVVTGKGDLPLGGATVVTHYDHRIAMSFLVLGLVSQKSVTVDDARAIATSFPNFMALMRSLGASIEYCVAPAEKAHKAMAPMVPEKRLVVAVDGPAASGKGTLARRIAAHLGCPYLDTGGLYRAVGMRVLYAGDDPENAQAALAAARSIKPEDLANPKLRGERVGQAASIVSAFPEVRQALLEYQRAFAAHTNGAVLDGRDIGTVICPDADVKFFITATLEARAKRRHKELEGYGVKVDYQSVYDELLARDERDAGRGTAPMIPADDAFLIDTSAMGMQEVFDLALQQIARAYARRQ